MTKQRQGDVATRNINFYSIATIAHKFLCDRPNQRFTAKELIAQPEFKGRALRGFEADLKRLADGSKIRRSQGRPIQFWWEPGCFPAVR